MYPELKITFVAGSEKVARSFPYKAKPAGSETVPAVPPVPVRTKVPSVAMTPNCLSLWLDHHLQHSKPARHSHTSFNNFRNIHSTTSKVCHGSHSARPCRLRTGRMVCVSSLSRVGWVKSNPPFTTHQVLKINGIGSSLVSVAAEVSVIFSRPLNWAKALILYCTAFTCTPLKANLAAGEGCGSHTAVIPGRVCHV